MMIQPSPDGNGFVLNLPFKVLTLENWMEADPICTHFAREVDGESVQLTAMDWASEFLTPTLNMSVPIEIGRLYEAARGLMVYGYFFHPIYALGEEQLFRTLDAACGARCVDLSSSSTISKFTDRIEFLVRHGVIVQANVSEWHAVRHLRNATSHPDDHSLVLPGQAVASLRDVTDKINHLYAP